MIEIVVNGSKLETSEGSDLSLVLNKSINDFDNISARSSSYSFDFELPPTTNNTRLLFQVSDVNAIGSIGREEAILLVDGVEYDRGVVFAFESEIYGNYTLTYQSGLVSWSDPISNLKLNKLFWRGVSNSGKVTATESFTDARINILNNETQATQDFIYPVINRNNDGTREDTRPQIYVKSFFERLFETIGWTVQGSFLELDEVKGGVTIQDKFGNNNDFKGLTFDPPFNFEVDDEVIEATISKYETDIVFPDTNYIVGARDLTQPYDGVVYTSASLNGFFNTQITDEGNLFDGDKYTALSSGLYNIGYRLFVDYYYSVDSSSPFIVNTSVTAPQIYFDIFVNSVLVSRIPILENLQGYFATSINQTLGQGDEVSFGVFADGTDTDGNPIDLKRHAIQIVKPANGQGFETDFRIKRVNSISLGDNFNINGQLPDINCLKLLQDFKLMYNLMFTTDDKNKIVTIDRWEDFYNDIGQAKNFTNKLDLSERPTINHLSEYAKEVEFRYKDDDSDGYLSLWQKINDRTYGKYFQALEPPSKFEEGQTVFETALISPSIQGTLNDTNIITSMSRREYDVNKEENNLNTGYNTRVYYTVRGKQYFNDGNERSGFTITTALMESYGNVPILDNNQLTFNGENGLVARNWRKTLATIQLGIRVNCNLMLSKYEFFNFDFSTPIYIEYPTKLKGYYLVEALDNFEVTDDNLYSTKAKLIKYRDFVGVEIDGSQKTNVNEDVNEDLLPDKTSVYTISNEGEQNETINRVYTIAGDGSINNVII